LLNYSLSVLP